MTVFPGDTGGVVAAADISIKGMRIFSHEKAG
jgi:hypothetical protein